jgi:hypothetical protein
VDIVNIESYVTLCYAIAVVVQKIDVRNILHTIMVCLIIFILISHRQFSFEVQA